MIETQECPHSPYLTPQTCVDCNGRAKAQAESDQRLRDRIVAQWQARYSGKCADCHGDINVDDIICRMGDGRILCSECS
jgi:hypothetical protein